MHAGKKTLIPNERDESFFSRVATQIEDIHLPARLFITETSEFICT